MNPQEIFGNDYNSFCEIDPYNPKNEVSGFISRKSNEFYGALIITHINNKKVPDQLIMGTPKMHYPFDSRADGSRNYSFPKAKTIEIYEKLDGTNILAYSYIAPDDYQYITYKTRLRPFLGSGKFGDFFNMWNEISKSHQTEIIKIIKKYNMNLSFELWGARNPHLVVYSVPLTFSLLFGINNEGKIFSPIEFGVISDIYHFPVLEPLKIINKDYVWNYEELQKELQSKLTQTEDGFYSGMEGTVWYLHTIESKCIQLKCKPETIEAIHFSQGVGLSKNVILATCWNAFENTDTLTLEFIKQLLIEEFKPEVVESKHYLIESCIDFVTKEMEFKTKVLEKYKTTGKNILLEKREVMRELSQYFPREKMKKVYSYIVGK